ncbi:MAG: hypothetical protein M0P71_04320 [Melioribacteraceae bacterium]|nr:hypothetical protein [Melioribacteraceae bacterium]
MIKNKFKFFIVFALIYSTSIEAQSFGFGCLGLSGFIGGYSQMNYKVDNLNSLINSQYAGLDSKITFKTGSGFKIGGNIFRARFESFFFSTKIYYQFFKEEKKISNLVGGSFTNEKYELTMNNWNVAIDLGLPIFSFLDLKVVEGGFSFYTPNYNHQTIINNEVISDIDYENPDNNLSYFVGSGFILHIIPDYISLEGGAYYSFYKINNFSYNQNLLYPNNESPLIEKGSIITSIQLNVGFPL